jgi:hypothetical protein
MTAQEHSFVCPRPFAPGSRNPTVWDEVDLNLADR